MNQATDDLIERGDQPGRYIDAQDMLRQLLRGVARDPVPSTEAGEP